MHFLRTLLDTSKNYFAINKCVITLLGVVFLCLSSTLVFAQTRTIDSLQIRLRAYQKEDTIKVNLLNTLGYKYWIVDANKSISFGGKALQLSEKINDSKGQARANRVIGVAYWSQGYHIKALEYLNDSHKIYEALGDKEGVANTRLNIGMVYSDLKDYDKALSYYEQAINEFTGLELKSRIATTFTKMGTILIELHKNDDALQYLMDALQMHIDSNFIYGIAEVHNRLGKLYFNKNEIEQAYYHIKKAMSLGDQVSDIHGLTDNLIVYGKILHASNKIDEATVEISKALQLAKENNLIQFELLAYEVLKELKKEQNKPEESFVFYDKYIVLKDSLFNSEKSKEIAYLEFKNEIEGQNKALLALKEKEKKNNLIKLILIIGVIILSIAGYVIYIISRQRSKKSKELSIKTQEYMESLNALTQNKLENSELKRQELRRQLDFKNKELTAYALNFIKKNEVVEQLQQTINKVKKSTTVEKGKLVTDLNKIIRKNLSIDKDWEDFSRFFDDVHKGFYSNLKSKHEGLTSNDLKICSLIRLNLNIKETASILAISPESVKTARYRLRKKLELDPQQEIFNYLVQLEQE
jgi:tetratricopeptide (TPR) repeat protein